MMRWMDLAVGITLLSILAAGGVMIHKLNADAQEINLNDEMAMRGQNISTDEGCIACHTIDGSLGVGPTWLGMIGRVELLDDGSSVIVDEAYFKESIIRPRAKKVEGYPDVMLRYFINDEDIDALYAFASQLSVIEAE